jgi:hypothetical protein
VGPTLRHTALKVQRNRQATLGCVRRRLSDELLLRKVCFAFTNTIAIALRHRRSRSRLTSTVTIPSLRRLFPAVKSYKECNAPLANNSATSDIDSSWRVRRKPLTVKRSSGHTCLASDGQTQTERAGEHRKPSTGRCSYLQF